MVDSIALNIVKHRWLWFPASPGRRTEGVVAICLHECAADRPRFFLGQRARERFAFARYVHCHHPGVLPASGPGGVFIMVYRTLTWEVNQASVRPDAGPRIPSDDLDHETKNDRTA